MSEYHIFCFLFFISLCITAINNKLTRSQTTIAITFGSFCFSVLAKLLSVTQWSTFSTHFTQAIETINFEHFLLHGILGLLLFAGALSVNIKRLTAQKWEVLTLAVVGTLLSTLFIGGGLYSLSQLFHFPLALIHCLLFGALISPTDPIAVLAIVKKLGAPESITTQVEGESLFNDGIGLVLFSTLFTIAFSDHAISLGSASHLFLKEVIGGLLMGAGFGFFFHFILKNTTNTQLKIILTVFIATGGYSAAEWVGVSASLAIVVAGIMIGNWTRKRSFTEEESVSLSQVWEIIDSGLNGILFSLVGFSLLTIHFNVQNGVMVLLAIPTTLLARYLCVSFSYQIFSKFRQYNLYSVGIITWGGLRGGLAIAMALSIPSNIWLDTSKVLNLKDTLLAMTYAVVIFSILIQGTTIPALIRKANNSR